MMNAVLPAMGGSLSAFEAAPLLVVRELGKRFDIHHLRRSVPAFKAVSFNLDRGEFLRLQGENGTGKSSLLRALFRSYRPGGGCALYQSERGPIDLVRAADVDIAWLRRHEIGFVTQFLQARPRVTAEELVSEALLTAGESHAAALEQAQRILADFGLKEELFAAYPTTFSGGEQQKVNLAHALIHPKRLILLDEPTASLDRSARVALAARLAELKTAGVALLGVFHHPEDVAHLIDRNVYLSPVPT